MLALSNLWLYKINPNKLEVMCAFPPDDLAKGLKDLDLSIVSLPIQRSLGVSWDVTEDVFTFPVTSVEKPYTSIVYGQ